VSPTKGSRRSRSLHHRVPNQCAEAAAHDAADGVLAERSVGPADAPPAERRLEESCTSIGRRSASTVSPRYGRT
jgi:hypothetical protein